MSILELRTELFDASLSVRHFSIEESLSSCFDISISARSPNPSVDLTAIVGQPASFAMTSGYAFANNGGSRVWSGVVAEASLVQAESSGLSSYFIRLVPRLWLLRHRRGYRIFQHLSIPDIVDKLLAEWNIEPSWSIHRDSYPPLEFKVQYGESDFDFFNHLLEEAGITYYFPGDDPDKSILTFVDEPHLVPPRQPILPFADNPSGSAEMEYVTKLRVAREVRPGALVMRDVDFRNPAFPLWGEAENARSPEDQYEQLYYVPGGFLHEGHKLGQTPFADDLGIARRTPEFGHERAQHALMGARAGRDTVQFETNAVDLWPGVVLQIENHPHGDLRSDRGLLVTRFSLEGSPDDAWKMSGEALFADVPYRPPLRTEKPRAYGVQSAMVVGPEGQEIHTDEFGRVRVQFPWDREGTEDETSSCWMRVNQGWGGQGYGFLVLPRVGQEVIVAFEQGDPDQPVIVGRAFNATNPVPYTLPENKTISTWKSNSSTGGQGFNEIKFEDKKSDELFYVQAEKNLRKLVKNDETITVGHDREKHVGDNETDTTGVDRFEVTGIDRSETTEGNRTTFVGAIRRKLVRKDEEFRTDGGHRKLTSKNADIVVEGNKRDGVGDDAHAVVVGNRSETINGDQSLIVVDNHYEKVTGSHALQTGKEIHLASGEMVAGEATRAATLKGPGGFVAIDAAGVTIKGTVVRINEGGAAGKGSGSHPQRPEEPAQLTLTEDESLINVFLYPCDIQEWISIWEGESGAAEFSDWVLGELRKPDAILEILRQDKKSLLERMALRGYSTYNIAQLPGYIQAKAQQDVGRRIRPLVVENIADAIGQISALQDEGYKIQNLILETHGVHGEGFYIGRKDAPNRNYFNLMKLSADLDCINAWRLLAERINGRVVLMGCQLGTNMPLLEKLATITCKNIIASRSWVSSWPGMFNDPVTRGLHLSDRDRDELGDIITAQLVRHYGEEIYTAIKQKLYWLLRPLFSRKRMRRELRKTVSTILGGVFDKYNVVSPSGCADAIFESYYCPSIPRSETIALDNGTSLEVTEEMMKQFHRDVGCWVEVSPSSAEESEAAAAAPKRKRRHRRDNRTTPNFYFDPHGNPMFDFPSFHETEFGKAYDTIIQIARALQEKKYEEAKNKSSTVER